MARDTPPQPDEAPEYFSKYINLVLRDDIVNVLTGQLLYSRALLGSVSEDNATFFKWRSKYGGATVSDVKRLRELEAENAKLKRMYADLALENAAIKDVLNRKL